MRPSEIRDLSDAELEARLREIEEEVFLLGLRRATSQLENPMKLRTARRELARLLTIRRERAKAG